MEANEIKAREGAKIVLGDALYDVRSGAACICTGLDASSEKPVQVVAASTKSGQAPVFAWGKARDFSHRPVPKPYLALTALRTKVQPAQLLRQAADGVEVEGMTGLEALSLALRDHGYDANPGLVLEVLADFVDLYTVPVPVHADGRPVAQGDATPEGPVTFVSVCADCGGWGDWEAHTDIGVVMGTLNETFEEEGE